MERFSSAQIRPENDPHYDVANVLMNIDNSSFQSFQRPVSRALDVTDLREALGTRTILNQSFCPQLTQSLQPPDGKVIDLSISAPPSIVSTAGAQTLPGDTVKKHRNNPDVKEVLREIFKDKKKQGAGGGYNRQNQNGSARSKQVSNSVGAGQKAVEMEMKQMNGAAGAPVILGSKVA